MCTQRSDNERNGNDEGAGRVPIGRQLITNEDKGPSARAEPRQELTVQRSGLAVSHNLLIFLLSAFCFPSPVHG